MLARECLRRTNKGPQKINFMGLENLKISVKRIYPASVEAWLPVDGSCAGTCAKATPVVNTHKSDNNFTIILLLFIY